MSSKVEAINSDERVSITTLKDLQGYADGLVVRFPDFAAGQPFVARVRRPSMMVLAKSGKIPNALLASATELFNTGGISNKDKKESTLKELYEIMEVIVRASLIEPSYEELEEADIQLTDDQMIAIFNYTQTGVESLKSFRKEPKGN